MTDQHSPCEHFAAVAYEAIVSAIPEEEYAEYHYPDDPGAQRRWLDLRVLWSLRGEPVAKRGPEPKKPKKEVEAREQPVQLAGHRIDWHIGLPELKIWAGLANLQSIVDGRRAALHAADFRDESGPLREWRLPYKTVSGLDPRTASTTLDIGFSTWKLGMEIFTFAADELLAVVGMQLCPIIRFGRKEYGYVDAFGGWWKFSVVDREGYSRMLTMSQRCEAVRAMV